MTPASAARLYFLRRFEGHLAPDTEHGPCCDLIAKQCRVVHTRGFQHIALTFGVPYVQLRREFESLMIVRAASAYLSRTVRG